MQFYNILLYNIYMYMKHYKYSCQTKLEVNAFVFLFLACLGKVKIVLT